MHASKGSQQPTASSQQPSFIVGIDLGTTNCAVAYVDARETRGGIPKIHNFEIPQLTRPGHAEARPLLPSFMYLAGDGELPAGSTALPWDKKNTLIVGELARELGAKTPGRLVASAKSWLCSPSVDRTAAILPWGAPEGVKRVSPVEASARYLEHIREAWDHAFSKGDKAKALAAQDVVITVPASFDEAARELTVEAAVLAGLPKITLLEEPQAAFYAWISENRLHLDQKLSATHRVLVCDVGGGTTDFSLIDVKRSGDERNPVELTRSAVGDHLMLGGDNMDLALARMLEKKTTGHLDAHQFKALTASSRDGKERLLSEKAPEKLSIAVVGRGSKVIGGSMKMELLREEVVQTLVEGFFPVSRLGDEPVVGRSGIREWGLPYVHDPAVTRHLGQFLRRHIGSGGIAGIPRPDAVLFNGGAMKPELFRARIKKVLSDWFTPADPTPGPSPLTGRGGGVVELDSPSLDLAVAIGAAYYGCARRGQGLRIGGGMGRSYYIGVEVPPDAGHPTGKAAICLVPRGTLEGDQLELSQSFILLASPVVFPLFSSSVRPADAIGVIIEEQSADLVPLPPLETVLHAGRRAVKKDVSVRLQASLTEVGTLELALKSVGDDRRWEVHLNIRGRSGPAAPGAVAGGGEAPQPAGGVDPRKVEAALALIRRAYDPQSREPIPAEILARQLEAALQLSKEAWPAPLARRLCDGLLDQAAQRERSAEHETRWLNLAGFTLRPGFGDLGDPERMKRLYNATRNALFFVSDPNCRIEWWVLWRRVAGGLKEDQERELYNRLLPFLFDERDVTKRGGWPRPSKGEVPEMWRASASLELLDNKIKKQLGDRVSDELTDEGPSTPLFWSLARIGAREPAHAPPHVVVSIELAEMWLRALLAMDWAGNPTANFAAVNLARKTGDRARDISDALRTKVLARLKKENAGEHDIAAVKTVTELESTDRKMIFGDALPAALQLKEEAD